MKRVQEVDGISYISNRYSKTNNKDLKSSDQKQFYGYEMNEFLQTSGFRLIGPKESNLGKYTGNRSKRCVFEIDLDHPKELHELNNDSPLAPYKTET